MSKHTPGPWLREDRTIYTLMHHGWRKGVEQLKNRFTVTVQKDFECSQEEIEANARLIAAAPELLKALKAIEARITYYAGLAEGDAPNIEQWAYTDQSGDLASARAAIAKAEAV